MTVEVHNVRFYNLEPKCINVFAYEEESKSLALSRSDNSIEVWNLYHSPNRQRRLLDTCGTVEGLAWYKSRLFSAGLQGSVVEYDLFTQTPKSVHPVTSGSCWCLAVDKNRKQLAAGTEDGYINVFDIMDDELVYNKILDRQEGRILCIAWDSKGECLVTGSVDTVRVWDVESGHVVHRMTTGRSEAKKETIVWSLDVTQDFTIISGDSRGKICFWDGKTGTNIASFQSHKADVLAVCLDKEQQTVYCTGVDPLIATYDRIKVRGQGERVKWVRSIQRIIHDHDIRALAFCEGKLFSGGVDGYLALSSYPPKVLLKYPPLLQCPSVSVSGVARCILLRYPAHLELWKLGTEAGDTALKLMEWYPQAKTPIRTAEISEDGKWLAVSTLDTFRLYSLSLKRKVPKLTKVKMGSQESLIAHCLRFSKDSKLLAVAAISGEINVVKVNKVNATVEHTFSPHNVKDLTDSVHLLAVSEDGTYVVAADLKSNIMVWSEGKIHCKLPKYNCSPTAMAIQQETDQLIVVYADQKIIEYSLPHKKFTEFSKDLIERHPKQWLSRNFPVQNVTFDPDNKDIIILHDDSTILVINKNKSLPEIDMKIPRLGSPHSINENSDSSHQFPKSTSPKYAFHVLKKYKHLVHFSSLIKGEMVAVEISPVSFKEQLPPPLKQKRFGGI